MDDEQYYTVNQLLRMDISGLLGDYPELTEVVTAFDKGTPVIVNWLDYDNHNDQRSNREYVALPIDIGFYDEGNRKGIVLHFHHPKFCDVTIIVPSDTFIDWLQKGSHKPQCAPITYQ